MFDDKAEQRRQRMQAILNADGTVTPAADLPPGLWTAADQRDLEADFDGALRDEIDAEADRLRTLPDPTVPITSAQAQAIGMDLDELLAETFGSLETGRAWLQASNPVLGGATPASYLERGNERAVRRLLLMAATGMPT